ncbi:hypothetical protein CcI49_28375 [Frankia sp. CcI49]|uniref:hypothetical protein n=1 Tax=Frankia sp. CcI49 TaxID=1745382 RepID=UPI0009765A96|nr:hypothetical protein [Frankia sp. CcI49]ONH55443.1 hypothetical protein CcI49_28375 [Frankia sp. CcI49]
MSLIDETSVATARAVALSVAYREALAAAFADLFTESVELLVTELGTYPDLKNDAGVTVTELYRLAIAWRATRPEVVTDPDPLLAPPTCGRCHVHAGYAA